MARNVITPLNITASGSIIVSDAAAGTPLILKGASGQTGDLLAAQNNSNTVVFSVASSGAVFSNSTLFTTSQAFIFGAADYGAALNVQSRSTTAQGIVVRGRASQSANLQEWQDNSGTVLSRISQLGSFVVAASGSFISGTTGHALIATNSAGQTPMTVRGAASQTADLEQWQNSAGTAMANVNSSGNISTNQYIGTISTTPNIFGMLYSAGNANQYAEGSLSTNAGFSTPVMLPNEEGYYPYWGFKTPNIVETSNDGTTWTVVDPTAYRGLFAFLGSSQTVSNRALRITFYQPQYTFLALVSARFTGSNFSNRAITMKTELLGSDYSTIVSTYGPTASVSPYDGAALMQKFNSYNGSTYATRVTLDMTNWTAGDTWTLGSLMAYISKPGTGFSFQNKLPLSWDINRTVVFQPTQPGARSVIVRAANTATSTITNAVASGTTITYTTSTPHSFLPGFTASITGIVSTGNPSATAGAGFNLTSATIATVPNQTQFTINNSLVDTYTSGGSLSIGQGANLQEWQNASSTILSRISSSGQFVSDQQTYLGLGAPSISNARLNVATGAATVIGAVIRGFATGGSYTQSANLQEWQTWDGTTASIITSINSAGLFSTTRNITIAETNAGENAFVIRGAANHTGYLSLWTDSSAVIDAGINAQGQFWTGSTLPVNGSTTIAINTQTPTGTTNITITTATAHGILVGQNVTIAGITPSGYNGNWIAQSGTTGSTLVVNIGSNPGAITVAGTVAQSAQLSATAMTANNTPLVVRGASSQSASIQEWQNNSGTILGRMDPSGIFLSADIRTNNQWFRAAEANSGGFVSMVRGTASIAAPGANRANFYFRDGTTTGLRLAVIAGASGVEETIIDNINTNGTASGQFVGAGGVNTTGRIITNLASDVVGATIRGSNGQTANLQEWQTWNGTTATTAVSITSAGNLNVVGQVRAGTTSSLSSTLSVVPSNTTTVGAVIRGVASQSANLQEWQNSAGTVLGSVNSSGDIQTSAAILAGTSTWLSATLTVRPLNQGIIGQVIRAAASQTANLFEIQNSSSTLLTKFDQNSNFYNSNRVFVGTQSYSNNTLFVQAVGATTETSVVFKAMASQTGNIQEWQDSAGTVHSGINASGFFFVGGASSPGGQIGIQTEAATNRGMVIKGSASQSANLQEWQNSAGTVLTHIDSVGRLNSTTAINVGGFTPGTAFVGIQTAPTVVGSIIRGSASQLSDLQQMQNSSATIIGGRNANAQIFTGITAPIASQSGGGATTATSGDGTTATITTTNNHNLAVGDRITVAGITPTGYNGTFIVTAITSNTVSYLNTTTGAQTVAGTVSVDAQASIVSRSAGTRTLVLRGASGQTAPLLSIQDSAATTLLQVTSAGNIQANALMSLGSLFMAGENNSGARVTMTRQTATDTAPGANAARLYFRDGTTTGLRLATIAGASGIEETIIDNINTNGTASGRFVGAGGVNTAGAVTATGDVSTSGILKSNQSAGDEGGQIDLSKPVTNTTLTTGVSIDVYQNRLRFFETGGTNRGFYIDISSGATSAGTNLASGGGGSFTGGTLTSALTLRLGSTTAGTGPLYFDSTSSGTNVLSTPVSGAVEYDGTVFYQTSNTNPGRALDTQNYVYVSNSTYSLDFSGSAAAQSILGGTTTGITLAAGTTYEYELLASVQMSYISATTMTLTHGFTSSTVSGSPTLAYTQTVDYGSNTTGFGTATTMSTARFTAATGPVIAASISTGNRFSTYRAKGTIRVTGTGSAKVYPSLTSSVVGDNGVTMQTGLIFKLTPIGNGTVTTVGTWA